MYRNILTVLSLWLMCSSRHLVFGVIDPTCASGCVCCIDKVCRPGNFYTNQCIIGCIDGHRGARCYELCVDNCKSCPEKDKCQVCYDEFYLSNDHCRSCPVNCQTCISDKECTSCKEGFENRDGSVCEYSICPVNCICDKSNCLSCKNGYFDVTKSCSRVCPSRCLTCTSLEHCNGCIDGYYNGYKTVNSITVFLNNCTHTCRETCKLCSSYDQCQQCQTGKYGNVCQFNCSVGCMGNSCVQVSGECQCRSNFIGEKCEKCVIGKYGNNCDRLCPSGCLTCTSVEECYDCIDGYYNGYKTINGISVLMNNCTHKCRETCKLCSSYDQCQQCQTGKYGNVCQFNCSVGCTGNSCVQVSGECQCRSNFMGEKCEKCVIGKYGNNCDKLCPFYCKNNECDKVSGNCTQGCATTDFIGSKCENCTNGKYGEQCDVTCPVNCNYQTCDRTSGECTYGCKGNFAGRHCTDCINGRYGSGCDLDCPDNCLHRQCEKQSGNCFQCAGNFAGIKCESCTPGFYGDWCIQNCSLNCLHGTCDIESGICNEGCKENFHGDRCCVESKNCLTCLSNYECGGCIVGYYGSLCNEVCPQNCQKTCVFETGVCDDCKKDFYGRFCNFSCSESCGFSEDRNVSRCHVSDGVCRFGCTVGHFGTTCNMTCSIYCSDNICEQELGTCTKGCNGQYEGSVCSRKIVATTPSPSIVGPVVGGGAAVLLLTAGVIAALLFYRRRHRRQDSDQSNVAQNKHTLKLRTETAGDGREYENIQGTIQRRNTEEKEVVDVTAIVIKDQSNHEQDDSEYYDYTNVKIENLFSYVTEDHVDLFLKDFQNLLNPGDLSTLCKVAKKPENISSNRYNGIYPFDHSRVTIHGEPSFFINACYIDGYNRSKAYIASLGPTIKHTQNFKTFWQMVWHEKSDIIVMLTNLREASGMKCDQYWPEIDTDMDYGQINVKCRSKEEFADYTVRCFTVWKGKEERNLTQLHYTAWPDKGVPSEVTSLVEFRQRVHAAPIVLDGPVIVHCSAGVGRTGTYIALDILTQKGKAEHSVDVFKCVNKMREQRVNMVQTGPVDLNKKECEHISGTTTGSFKGYRIIGGALNFVLSSYFTEQYIFLHKALVHTLTFGCEALTAEELQSQSFEKDGAFMKMYQTLKQEVDIEEEEIAAREENQRKYADKSRRHSDIPGSRGRVRLYLHRKSGNHDYINAVFINSFKIKNLFIAAQTPQANTVEDFLCMIYQQNSSCVVALEDPLQLSKKHDIGIYLPADNETYKYGDFTVTSSKFENKPQYTMKKLTIKHTDKGEEKIVYNFQYTQWGHAHKVPGSPRDFIQFVKDVETHVKQQEADMPNVVIHCMNGYERSGLFCVVYTLLEKLEAEGQVSVVNIIRKVRTQRKLSISSVEQLKFCFQCISAYLEFYSTYSNFAA